MKTFIKRYWLAIFVAIVLATDLAALCLLPERATQPGAVGISYLFYLLSGYLICKDVNRG